MGPSMQLPLQSTKCDVSPVSNGDHGFILNGKENMDEQGGLGQHASSLPANCEFNMKNNKSNDTVNVNQSSSANIKTTTNDAPQGHALRHVPPNHLIVPPSYTLDTITKHQHLHSNINNQSSTTKNNGPKNDLIHSQKPMALSSQKSSSALHRGCKQSKLRGAEKIGFARNQSINTHKAIKSNSSTKDIKSGTQNEKKRKSKNYVFIATKTWAESHSYRQYCPFCVRDSRKKSKQNFWNDKPNRDKMNKSQRKHYDIKCKEYLQKIEDRVKAECIFKSGTEYKQHYDAFHKKHGFICIYSGCDKESSSWYNFVAHLTQHDKEGGRPFHCAFPGCNRRSSTKHNLITHLKGVHKWKIVNKNDHKRNTRHCNNDRDRQMLKIIPCPDHEKITREIASNIMPTLNMDHTENNNDIEMTKLSFPILTEQKSYSCNLAQDINLPTAVPMGINGNDNNGNASKEIKQEPLKDLEKICVKPHYQTVQEQEDHIFSIDDATPITPSYLNQQVQIIQCNYM